MHQSKQQVIKQNFSSGLVVFLVALPLCLGIALASGAPPLAGVISGVLGGIVVGLLSTSHISVAGPAAGLTAIVLSAITDLGSFELFLCSVMVAGILQFILGVIRAGSITNYFPIAVIEGMLAGIGILIIFKQLPYGLGNHEFNWQTASIPIHFGSLIVTVFSMLIIIGWEQIPRLKQIKILPSALIAVLVGIGLNQLFIVLDSPLAISGDQLVQLPDTESWQDLQNLIRFPDWRGLLNPQVWAIAATIAVIASIETLLSVEAADRLDKRRRLTDSNQELRAQGIGNLLAGLIGGLPMTAVIVRSSANANAGATHRLSTITHGFLLLICVLTIPNWLNKIPLACLAAVLILVGYKLTQPQIFKRFWHKGIYQFIPFLATMLAVVCLDLLKGVGIGLIISIVFILHGNMKRAYYLSREELANASTITLQLAEEVSFLNKAAIKKTLKNIHPNSTIIINAERTSYIATDVLELIEEFTNIYAEEHHIHVILKGFTSDFDNHINRQSSNVHVEHRSQI